MTFDLARLVFDDPNAIDRLDLDEYAEDRMLITGLVGDVLLTVCFVQRGHRTRIISARKATYRAAKTTTKRIRNKAARIGESDHGMTPAMWARLRSKTNAEVEAAARTDPDNPPMTKAEAAQMSRVSLAKRARWKAGLSQEAFARQFGFPLGTLRDWEQHRTEPNQAMTNYLKIILDDPEAAAKTVAPA